MNLKSKILPSVAELLRRGGVNLFLIAIFILCIPVISIAQTVNLPETGQTTCYDSDGNVISCTDTGQDGDTKSGILWPNPRFTDNGDGTVTDNLTGLVWLKNANCFGSRTWSQALSDCNGLASGSCGLTDGSSVGDWRLPNISELESLVNAEEPNPATWLTSQGFTNVQSYYYWSSTSYANVTFYAWNVYMVNGIVHSFNKTNNFYVWPVRSGSGGSFDNSEIWKTGQTTCYDASGNVISCAGTRQDGDIQAGVAWPNPRFTDNGDGTVTDNLTGLMWAQNANPSETISWQQALDYVKGMNSGANPNLGYTDWRLPNRKELFSLIDRSQYGPAIQSGHPFIYVQSGYYWSSTSYANLASRAWDVNMNQSNVGINNKANNYYVWPVRSGSGGSSGPPVPVSDAVSGTWTNGNTYNAEGAIWVPENLTLTIQSGVTVNLNGYPCTVYGNLIIESGATVNWNNTPFTVESGGSMTIQSSVNLIGNCNPFTVNGELTWTP